MKQKYLFAAALSLGALNSFATAPLWMRDVKISPDGETLAFTYMGDIWTVPTKGGKAVKLTDTDNYYEDHPIWSPDSKSIAFSSNRTGSFDIFTVDAAGGTPVQITFDSANETPEAFSADGSLIYFSAALQDDVNNIMFPTGRMTEFYQISTQGGNPIQLAGIPIQMPTFTKNNPDIIYYQDMKGMEDEWRKHHTSSVTRDIWQWNRTDNSFKNITKRGGEDRNPVISANGQTIYFLREEPGQSFNLYSMATDGSQVKKLTDFTDHPVRFLSGADNGLLAFTFDGEIYTMSPGQTPQKVNIDVTTDNFPSVRKINVRDVDDAAVSPDGKSVAFISRGEVFVTSVDYSTTKQITNTPQAELQVSWSPDGDKLLYTSERDGHWNIYTAKKAKSDEPNFENSTVVIEEALFPGDDNIERSYPSFSPDGKKLAYIQDRNKLMVKDLASGNIKELLDGHTYLTRDGGYEYSWSPDGNWILTYGVLHHHDPYYDIFLVNTNDGEMIPLTETGYFDEQPRFVLDGEAVIFASERYGMRNHASWGSLYDVMINFLNEEAYDKFTLSEEDYKLKKEIEKSNSKKEDKKDDKDKKKKGKEKDDDADSKVDKNIKIDRKNIQDRTVRLTPASADISDAFVTSDGETLYYLASFNKGYDLWKINLRDGTTEEVRKLGAKPSRFITDKDGENVFLVSGSSIKKFNPSSEKLTEVDFEGKMLLDPIAEREYMFDFVKNQERERFYTVDMHGVDWENLTEHYRKFLPHITNNYDFAEMLSELLGELNVSHTGSRYYAPTDPNGSRTASLGLLINMQRPDDGMLVEEVLTGGPMDKPWSQIQAGDLVLAINDVDLTSSASNAKALADVAGKKTRVKFRKPDGRIIEEVVLPISKGEESELLYQRWIKNRAADVDKWSNGRLGYVHIRSMDDDSFREIYADILGKYKDRDGIVIDVRWNGGGRLHEDIEVLFSGNEYFKQFIRGEEAGTMPSRRWNKPSIMVQAEPCYSNAHGTPWVYKHTGLGKLVGAPVPGTMTSVNWVRMQDPTMIFGIPVTGYKLPDGSYLENTQLEPDILVFNSPEQVMNGEDNQLHTAVITLLEEIDAR
ncbi:MAG: PD40 domain-containing protein [Muribaculaceae bacterium]|nr:PD40 domain-containing protein [Muribaculaceae bacterium]